MTAGAAAASAHRVGPVAADGARVGVGVAADVPRGRARLVKPGASWCNQGNWGESHSLALADLSCCIHRDTRRCGMGRSVIHTPVLRLLTSHTCH